MIELVLLLLTLPVSSSSCEPAFSTLKIAKSFLRNTMGQTRLNDLVEMLVASEELEAIKIGDIRDLYW